jgi:hypothetical protein
LSCSGEPIVNSRGIESISERKLKSNEITVKFLLGYEWIIQRRSQKRRDIWIKKSVNQNNKLKEEGSK